MPAVSLIKAGASALPGAGRLPFLPGGGGSVPDHEIQGAPRRADPEHLAAYARVCGFTMRDALPATWPHIEAFGLHMQLLTDGAFPFGPMGLVHISNEITQIRPIAVDEELAVNARATDLEAHPKGRAFSLISEGRVGDELVWHERSTMLRRGRPEGDGAGKTGEGNGGGSEPPSEPPPVAAWWKLPGDLGARYAAVSGDSNPIHMHALTAKAFGFPRAIAHGMWTKARCLAALESLLPDAFTVSVQFGKPILLPNKVGFGGSRSGDQVAFAVQSRKGGTPHLEGRLNQNLTKTTQQ